MLGLQRPLTHARPCVYSHTFSHTPVHTLARAQAAFKNFFQNVEVAMREAAAAEAVGFMPEAQWGVSARASFLPSGVGTRN